MTKQESFKRRIRERMATTGERYAEARRILIEQAGPADGRVWVSVPEMSDDAVRKATGKGWNEWCDVLDRFPGRNDGHKAIADHLRDDLGVDAWWSQSVTGGYERITGLRLPGEMPDGTFTANKSLTLDGDADVLRAMLLDDDQRGDLFPGLATELRSKPTAKAVRIAIGDSLATIGLHHRGSGRAKVTVQHSKLATVDDVDEWKFYWADWLEAIDGATG